jgi:hypothetical protein
MIAEEKRQIILSEGTDVEVFDSTGNLLFQTKALIGKATKQFMSEISLEYHRKAQFIPELDIPNGVTVRNTATGETYLAIANMVETYGGEKLSTILRLVETNATITVTGLAETADEYGNISTSQVTKAQDMPVHIESSNAELRQYQPGLHEKAEYLIYMPAIDIQLLDKVTVNAGGRILKLKVEHVDYLSFVGIAVLSVCTETRK